MTWTAYSNRATNATYQVFDGPTLLTAVQINQQLTPAGGLTVNGTPFQSLGQFSIHSGNLKVVLSDNANGYVIANAMLAQVSPVPKVIDNGQVGYSETGTAGILSRIPMPKWQRALRPPGSSANTATWQASNLAADTYDVEITWTAYFNRATNATYQVYDGTTLLGTVQVNQQLAPRSG